MIPYATVTGTLRNIAAMRQSAWRLLVTPTRPKPHAGFRYACDNDAWRCHQQGIPFDEVAFERMVERIGAGADFVVVPDIVAGGMASLELSLSWLPKLRHLKLLLLPVQDGMDVRSVSRVLTAWPKLGLFLGGSTEWKLRTIYQWGTVAASFGRWYHVARVNTVRRIRLCAEANATSFDGTSASRYSCTLPLLDTASRQPSLLTPIPTIEMPWL